MAQLIRQAFVRHVNARGMAIEVTGLRVAFDVAVSSAFQDESLVSIYNLSNARISAIAIGDDVLLEVSHRYPQSDRSTIHSGRVIRVETAVEQTDRRTDIYIGGTTLAGTLISETWPDVQPMRQIIEAIATQSALSLASDADIPNLNVRDASVSGTAADALDALLSPHSRVAIQVGAEVKVYRTGATSDRRTRRVSESSGMIGVPSLTDSGVRVRVLLNGDIEPQSKIDLVSAVVPSANGVFRVTSIKHVGDTGNSPDWYSELDCVPAT